MDRLLVTNTSISVAIKTKLPIKKLALKTSKMVLQSVRYKFFYYPKILLKNINYFTIK